MPAWQHELHEFITKIQEKLGLKLIPIPSRSRGEMKQYRVDSPLGVELFEVCIFYSEDRGWHLGGCAWSFNWQGMNDLIAPVKEGD